MTNKEFWQAVYIAAIQYGSSPAGAKHKADMAVGHNKQSNFRPPLETPKPKKR